MEKREDAISPAQDNLNAKYKYPMNYEERGWSLIKPNWNYPRLSSHSNDSKGEI